jgi:hypothetical protein
LNHHWLVNSFAKLGFQTFFFLRMPKSHKRARFSDYVTAAKKYFKSESSKTIYQNFSFSIKFHFKINKHIAKKISVFICFLTNLNELNCINKNAQSYWWICSALTSPILAWPKQRPVEIFFSVKKNQFAFWLWCNKEQQCVLWNLVKTCWCWCLDIRSF